MRGELQGRNPTGVMALPKVAGGSDRSCLIKADNLPPHKAVEPGYRSFLLAENGTGSILDTTLDIVAKITQYRRLQNTSANWMRGAACKGIDEYERSGKGWQSDTHAVCVVRAKRHPRVATSTGDCVVSHLSGRHEKRARGGAKWPKQADRRA